MGLGLFVAVLATTLLTEAGYGVASDVGNYMDASRLQIEWARDLIRALFEGHPFTVLEQDVVSEHWRSNLDRIPHPPLSRELSGLGYLAFRGVLDPVAAYRVPVMTAYAALVAGCGLLTAWGSRSWVAGAVAAGAALTLPALFAHGHLANTDLFVTAFWFGAAASLYMYTEAGGRGWLLAAGIFLGSAAATKFTGVLLVPALLLWLVLRGRRDLKPMLGILASAALVFFVVNPVMWVDPLQGTWDYLRAGMFRSISVHIPTLYFGEVYSFRGPWHFPFVWTAIVIPIPLLVAMGLGLANKQTGRLRSLVLVNLGVIYGVTLLPATPLHDGIRLFLPAFPFLCVLAGLGAAKAYSYVQTRVPEGAGHRSQLYATAVVVAILAQPAVQTVRYHPHQLSYFNGLIGGVSGAYARGLEVTTQKEALNRKVLADLAREIPPGTVIDPGFMLEEICVYQALGWAPRAWVPEMTLVLDQDERLYAGCVGPDSFLREQLEREAREPAFLFVYQRYTMMQRLDLSRINLEEPPFYEVSLQDVPLLSIYEVK